MTRQQHPAGGSAAVSDLRLVDGVFTANVHGAQDPVQIDIAVDGRVVGAVKIENGADASRRLIARLPRQAIRDGDTAITLQDRQTGDVLSTYIVSAGYVANEDLHASFAGLRAELTALKRAFLAEAWHEKLRKTDRPAIVAEVLEAVEQMLQEKDADPRR